MCLLATSRGPVTHCFYQRCISYCNYLLCLVVAKSARQHFSPALSQNTFLNRDTAQTKHLLFNNQFVCLNTRSSFFNGAIGKCGFRVAEWGMRRGHCRPNWGLESIESINSTIRNPHFPGPLTSGADRVRREPSP